MCKSGFLNGSRTPSCRGQQRILVYEQLNRLLEGRGFDEYVEQQCTRFHVETMGRPSLAPGRYFRLLLIGYFEGIDSERGIAWRAADSLGLRSFLNVGLKMWD